MNKNFAFKKIIILFFLLTGILVIYVLVINRNTTNMTIRQKLLKAFYPITILLTKTTGSKNSSRSNASIVPLVPLYDLHANGIDGTPLQLSKQKGKKIMFVNTASDCGYTSQYEGLERLSQQYKGSLLVVAFPANDFQQQEKGNDKQIAEFCKKNYGVSFPLMQKSKVVKGEGQHEIFQWLTDKNKNGWNDQEPTWNFCKYLVNEKGTLVNVFESSIEPMSREVLDAVEAR